MVSGNHYKNGVISISVERFQYRPGETVCGYVSLSVTGPLSCSDLHLRFRGEARTRVKWTEMEHDTTDSSGASNTREVTRHAEDSATLCSMTLPLAHFPDGHVNMGYYQFPFTLELPSGLPAAFAVHYPSSSACILYSVSVKLKRPGIFTWDMRESVVVDIIVPVPPHLANAQEVEVDDVQQVSSCCCINKGQVRLAAYLNKQVFFTTESYDFSWQVTNGSTADVKRVTASLVRRGSITAQGHTDRIKDPNVHFRIISSGADLRRAASETENATRFLAEASPTWQTEKIPIPPDLTPSVDHPLVRLGYGVKLKAEMKGTCMGNPSVELPILIFREAPISMGSFAAHAAQNVGPDSGMVLGMPAPYKPNPAAKPPPMMVASSHWMQDPDAAAPTVV